VLTAHNLECVRGERRLFTALNFTVQPGTLLAVRGVNGSGKTSLLRMMCGLLAPAAGTLSWKQQEIGDAGEEYRSQLIYLGHLNGLKDELDATENLRLSLRVAGVAVDEAQAMAALEWSGLRERRHQPCGTLSQGQRRRVALARLKLSQSRPLWILDEPFTALDVASVERTRDLIVTHLAAGGMVALTTHQDVPINAPITLPVELGP
jgi:heme exporter protein A